MLTHYKLIRNEKANDFIFNPIYLYFKFVLNILLDIASVR